MNNFRLILAVMLISGLSVAAQSTKPKSYIISKQDLYSIEVKSDQPSIVLSSKEKMGWCKDNIQVKANRIGFVASFPDITEIEAYAISSDKKKKKYAGYKQQIWK